MSEMKYIHDIDFHNITNNMESRYERLHNPIMKWRDEALRAYQKIEDGDDNPFYLSVVISCWIDYICLTKGSEYAKSHRKLANENMLEVYRIAVNGFNLTEC